MLIESSKDILYLVLAFSVLVLTIFLVWLLGEAAFMLRHVNRTVREVREKLRKMEALVSGIRDKLEHSASYLSLLATVAKQLVNTFLSRRKKKKH